MTETTSSSIWISIFSGTALSFALSTISAGAEYPVQQSLTLLRGSVLTCPTVSRSESLPGEAHSVEEVRIAQIKSLRGKYRDVLTPSDEFARQKEKEIDLER